MIGILRICRYATAPRIVARVRLGIDGWRMGKRAEWRSFAAFIIVNGLGDYVSVILINYCLTCLNCSMILMIAWIINS